MGSGHLVTVASTGGALSVHAPKCSVLRSRRTGPDDFAESEVFSSLEAVAAEVLGEEVESGELTLTEAVSRVEACDCTRSFLPLRDGEAPPGVAPRAPAPPSLDEVEVRYETPLEGFAADLYLPDARVSDDGEVVTVVESGLVRGGDVVLGGRHYVLSSLVLMPEFRAITRRSAAPTGA